MLNRHNFWRIAFVTSLYFVTSQAIANISTGTGFFVTTSGHIVTNYHVIEGTKSLIARDWRGNSYAAKVVRIDSSNDLAIIKIDGGPFPPLAIARSSGVRKGLEVFTLGFPNINLQGSEAKLTEGSISSLSGVRNEPNNFQISVPIQPGNSGGPLLNREGNVIGVIVAKLSAEAALKSGSALPENVNYAIKSNYLLELTETDPNVKEQLARPTHKRDSSFPETVALIERSVVLIIGSHEIGKTVALEPRNTPTPPVAIGPIAFRVNGRTIPKIVYLTFLEEQTKKGSKEDDKLRAAVIEELIRRELLMMAAKEAGIGSLPDNTKTVTALEAQSYLAQSAVLIRAYLSDYVRANPVSDDKLKKDYEAIKANLGTTEYKVKHILVSTEDEAKAIIAKLEKGDKFADLAKQSKDPGSKDNGGELGWSSPSTYVKPFAEAVTKLKKGEYTKTPVKTDFGYHVIALEDTRPLTPPPYEQVKPQLQQRASQQQVEALVKKLREGAKVN